MLELKRPTQTELDRMSAAEKDALILSLFDVLEAFGRRLRELEGKVEKTSKNSSKPPSSDGLKKAAAEPRKKGERPVGGVPGHPGATLEMTDTPDRVEELRPQGSCECGAYLEGLEAVAGERRQQIEMPEPRATVTEYRQMRVECPGCGRAHAGMFPPSVTPNVSYGPRLKAYAVGLAQGHFVGLERVCAIVADQCGVRPSGWSVQQWIVKAGQWLAPQYEAGRQAVAGAAVAHFDESGMRINGTLNWLHVAATDTAVHYTAHPKRGREAMDAAGILPGFRGIAVHDHWKPYRVYTHCSHALCNAHHLRELNYCEELTGHWWPVELRRVLLDAKDAVADAQAAGLTALEPAQRVALLARYDAQIQIGLAAWPVRPPEPGGNKGPAKQHEATNLLLRLRDYKDQVLRFLTDWRVPFDNNLAERMVRPVKVKLKVIGGFRAVGGADAFCVIRSVWETSKLNGLNPFDTLRLAFEGW
jgi:transposase